MPKIIRGIQEMVAPKPSERCDVTRALEAITEVIIISLSSDDPKRFAEAERVCKVAQQLIQAISDRVADMVDEHGNYQQLQLPHGTPLARPILRPPRDGLEMQHDLVSTITGPMAAQGELSEARTSSTRANELDRLLDIKDQLEGNQRKTVEDRIDMLITLMRAETDADKKGQQDGLVHSNIPRGHQARGQGGENGASRLRLDHQREGSFGQAQSQVNQE